MLYHSTAYRTHICAVRAVRLPAGEFQNSTHLIMTLQCNAEPIKSQRSVDLSFQWQTIGATTTGRRTYPLSLFLLAFHCT